MYLAKNTLPNAPDPSSLMISNESKLTLLSFNKSIYESKTEFVLEDVEFVVEEVYIYYNYFYFSFGGVISAFLGGL